MNYYIDLGTWIGNSLINFMNQGPDPDRWQIICFEPQEQYYKELWTLSAQYPKYRISILPCVTIDRDGVTDFYVDACGGEGSTTLLNKFTNFVDYKTPLSLPCIDFSAWLKQLTRPGDYVAIRMNIEGGEYIILDKMMTDDTLKLIDQIRIDWHDQKFSDINQAVGYRRIAKRFYEEVKRLDITCFENDGLFILPERL